MNETEVRIAAPGMQLGGTLFRGETGAPAVVINGATAVPSRFYHRFARHLQAQGWSVLTYDYRGFGASRPESLKGFDAKASDWGLKDIPAAVAYVRSELAPERLFLVGHSAGGQQAGLLPDGGAVDAMLTVSSQSGHWRWQGGVQKLNVLVMSYTLLPLLPRLIGYLPWSWFAAGEDIPREAALQWARWCRARGYLLDDATLPLERYARFRAPVLACSIDDDAWGTERSVRKMMSAYPNVEYRHLVPADFGLAAIGHMGFFRAGSEPLWEMARQWLESSGGHRRAREAS